MSALRGKSYMNLSMPRTADRPTPRPIDSTCRQHTLALYFQCGCVALLEFACVSVYIHLQYQPTPEQQVPCGGDFVVGTSLASTSRAAAL